jgi:3-hydroxyisobutyrate dehydrogenase-like beta-hydroxyacid dehydrogenase
MVGRLLDGGYDVVVYARREDLRRRLEAKGAAVTDSVADLARDSDILISCLFSDAQLRETGLGADGFIANAKPGAVFVSHTTGTVSTLETLRNASTSAPVVLDAPVSGTADDIAAGTLTVLIGGPDDAVASVTPLLAAYADPVVPTGPLGSALAKVDQQPAVRRQRSTPRVGNAIGHSVGR